MFDKFVKKVVDRSLYGSEKDRRIKELWFTMSHVLATIETYGHMADYEANPDWEPPVYLRDGEYTIDKRLADIRHNSDMIMKCAEDMRKVMFKDVHIGPEF